MSEPLPGIPDDANEYALRALWRVYNAEVQRREYLLTVDTFQIPGATRWGDEARTALPTIRRMRDVAAIRLIALVHQVPQEEAEVWYALGFDPFE